MLRPLVYAYASPAPVVAVEREDGAEDHEVEASIERVLLGLRPKIGHTPAVRMCKIPA